MIITLIVLIVSMVCYYSAAALSESAKRYQQLRREFKPCEPVKFCELYPIMLDDESAASYFRQR